MQAMKKVLLPILILILVFPCAAQKLKTEEVPATIVQASVNRIPDSAQVQWIKRDSLYLAQFKHKGISACATFNTGAEWLNTQWELPLEYLPKKISSYLAEHYPAYKISECLIEYKGGGEYYLVGLKKKKDRPMLRFNIKSVFMMKE